MRNSSPRFPHTTCADMLPDPRGQTTGLPVGDFLPRSRSIQGPPDPPLLSCSTWWPAPRSRHPYAHTQAARADSYTNTPDFSGKGAPLPSLPGSMTLSCASGRRSVIPTTLPSGSSPRLSATRATLSRASASRALQCKPRVGFTRGGTTFDDLLEW
jgi:hypothetical protein